MFIKNILFLPLNLPILEIDYDRLSHVCERHATRDEYRNCEHIAIYTSLGSLSPGNLNKENLQWTSIAEKYFPDLINYINVYVRPWMEPLGRIAIICTLAGEENPPHIDCDRKSFSSLQLKFRHVLHGHSSDLKFLTREGEVSAPTVSSPFLMAGEWPHKMKNTSKKTKFTLAIGSPWRGESYPGSAFNSLLESSFETEYLLKTNYQLNGDYENLFYNN